MYEIVVVIVGDSCCEHQKGEISLIEQQVEFTKDCSPKDKSLRKILMMKLERLGRNDWNTCS